MSVHKAYRKMALITQQLAWTQPYHWETQISLSIGLSLGLAIFLRK